ncbi:MAG: LPS export ABC transporter periplasmic protein LptC [Desulfomonilia bacterium]|jgi:hypothetical protein
MWNKLILLTGVIVVLAFIISVSRDNQMAPSLNKGTQPRRQAMNVVMYERNRQNNKTMEVSAREVDETGDQDVRLKDFVLTQTGGLKLSGVDAFYDRAKSILEVKGPVNIETQNGSRARLNNLTWDRVKNFAHTDNPIVIEGESGVITADRAEFSDQFTNIACIGRVHAKVMQNILNL